jgi:proton-dependent oligopeptide transporter, POT family
MHEHDNPALTNTPTLFGHPVGLFTLFFAEMWERFCFYGMRALLVMYMGKAVFLKYDDTSANAVYGAFTALVYMTPFLGGILADRLLGQRRAVIFGAMLMVAGELLMMVPHTIAFFTALAFLIAGNGFFKPNISTIVGSLYPAGSKKRDGGFTIFYMGINLGAAIAPLLCGYIAERYGYHWGFGLAAIGMIIGLATFVAPTILTQVLILLGAVAIAAGLMFNYPDNWF